MLTKDDALLIAKQELNADRKSKYDLAKDGVNVFTVSEGKTVTISGGEERLTNLKFAYDSLFVHASEVDGNVKQADGTLVNCTKAEWDELIRLMTLKGGDLFRQNETLIAQIDALTVDNTLTEIYSTIWENLS